jgi:uncharacterized protein YqeY
MSLKDQITEDMKTAMRAKDSERLGTIRLLLAAMQAKGSGRAHHAGRRRRRRHRRQAAQAAQGFSIAAFTQAARQDLADKEIAEVTVLQAYLPARLSADEVAAEVKAIVAELGASGPGDMGKVMGAVKARLAGKADMGQVSAAVKAALAG